jgi:molybdopterin synthase catalytic subunit
MRVSVQQAAFAPAQELADFAADRRDIGAVVSFTGLVRDTQGDLQYLEIEHYPGMTERAIAAIVDQALARWDLADVLVIHRYGQLAVGAPIMMVAVASAHRADSFAAADFLMDYLKSRAPFWKKEQRGTDAQWVCAKASDEQALQRWRAD